MSELQRQVALLTDYFNASELAALPSDVRLALTDVLSYTHNTVENDRARAAWLVNDAVSDEDMTVHLIEQSDTWCEGDVQTPLSFEQARRAVDVLMIYLSDAIRGRAG